MSRLGMLIRVTARAHTTYYTAGPRDHWTRLRMRELNGGLAETMADQIPESTPDRAKWLAQLGKRKQRAVPESNATKEARHAISIVQQYY